MSDDSDDVVRRYNGARPMQAPAKLLDDAIREVEILREENARLRRALSYYAEENYNGYNGSGACARTALKEGGDD